MANSINVNGCSVCQPGRENYTSFTAKIGRKTVKRWQYDYRTESGEYFPVSGNPSITAAQSGIYGSLKSSRIMATKKAIKTYEVEVSMTWSQSYTVKAKTAAEARRKARRNSNGVLRNPALRSWRTESTNNNQRNRYGRERY